MSRSIQNFLILGSLFAFGSSGAIRPAVAETEPTALTLRVLVCNDARVPQSVLGWAQQITSRIFRNAGIELVWIACPADNETPATYPDCRGPFGLQDLVVRIRQDAIGEVSLQGDVFGLALIAKDGGFSRQAYVFFGRLENLAWGNVQKASWGQLVSHIPPRAYSSVMLGVVLAHELGHLLLGSNSHSNQGIMRPSWGPQALEDAYGAGLASPLSR